jgi:hypothetical protein
VHPFASRHIKQTLLLIIQAQCGSKISHHQTQSLAKVFSAGMSSTLKASKLLSLFRVFIFQQLKYAFLAHNSYYLALEDIHIKRATKYAFVSGLAKQWMHIIVRDHIFHCFACRTTTVHARFGQQHLNTRPTRHKPFLPFFQTPI